MKTKKYLLKPLFAFIALLFLCPLHVFASGTSSKCNENLKLSVGSVINGGNGIYSIEQRDIKDWYIMALSPLGFLDDSRDSLIGELDGYTENNKTLSDIDKLRISLSYLALGEQNAFVLECAGTEVNRQNIMCLTYSLILCGNIDEYSDKCSQIAEIIIDKQIDGKGWSLIGKAPVDTDVTAMVLSALSPYKDIYVEEINASLEWLSSVQNPDGSFSSYGVSTSESTAQVIIALSSLGINPSEDERFIKSGSLLDALLGFRTDGGRFSHIKGSSEDDRATAQAILAMVSLILLENNAGYIYDYNYEAFDRSGIKSMIDAAQYPSDALQENTSGSKNIKSSDKGIFIFKSVAAGAVLIVSFFLIINSVKKTNDKKIALTRSLTIAAISAAICILICFIRITPKQNAPPDNAGAITVTLSVECKNALGKTDNDVIPNDGIIADAVQLTVPDGCSVYYVLDTYCRKNNIHLDGSNSYISGICHLYEKDVNTMSGWLYFVNGSSPSVSVGKYKLSDGDIIEIKYTCDMGKDLR